MSDSVRPHRRLPTRLPHPWDSPGKNTGVGCHFLLQGRKVKSESEVAQSGPTPSDPMDCSPPGSSVHGSFQARGLEWVAMAFVLKLLYLVHLTHTHTHTHTKNPCFLPLLSPKKKHNLFPSFKTVSHSNNFFLYGNSPDILETKN